MARHALDRRFALLVAVDAIAHIHVHRSLRGRLFGHVAVTRRARHRGANVWRVIEPDVRRRVVVIHAHPGNFLTFAAAASAEIRVTNSLRLKFMDRILSCRWL